eukprot:11745640-Ditylum_brightwellii.AAC.1
MQKRAGYTYFTKIDLSVFFYTMLLDEKSKELCTIVTPFGKFQYYRMPMGLKIAPDEAQAVIDKILQGMDIDAYIDDVGIFSNGTFEGHMKLVGKVLKLLENNGMKVNPLKRERKVKETDFLGHWITPEG